MTDGNGRKPDGAEKLVRLPRPRGGLRRARMAVTLTKVADSGIPPMPVVLDVSAAVAMFKSDRTAIEHEAASARPPDLCDLTHWY
jgi:hypothetical protein